MKKIVVSIYMDEKTKKLLREKAKSNGRSASTQAVRFIKAGLNLEV